MSTWRERLREALDREQSDEQARLDAFWAHTWSMYGTYHLIEPIPVPLEDA